MATRKSTQPNYFGNLRTPAANFANSSGINTFDAVSKGAAAAQRGMRRKPQYTQDELDKMRADNVVAKNLDESPQISWGSYDNIPSDITAGWNEKIQNLGAQIGYEKHIQQNMGKTDFQGRSQMANNISNKTSIITSKIPKQLATLNEMYGGFDEDYMDGIMSDMMDPKDKQLISDIQHGKIKPEMDDEGNITFNGMSINDLPQYHNKDLKTGSMLTKNLVGAFDRGSKLTENELALQRVNITNTLNEGGIPSILSVGFEDVMGMGGSLLDKKDYQSQIADLRSGDPMKVREAKQVISNAITDEYLSKLSQQADLGYDAKNPANPNGATESKFGKRIDDLVNAGGGFTIPVGGTNYQVVEYPRGSGEYKLFTGKGNYMQFREDDAMRNTRTLSSDPAKRKQQILEAVTGDISQGFKWTTPETDWSSAPESNVPFIGPMPGPTANPSIITNN
tara:strand:+ start:259 stop:1611 length:1353 start_codon:yes stop_codon:yes gene_type:complete